MAVIFSCGHNAVVTHGAIPIDAGVVKTAVHGDIDEAGGVVAVIAFNRGLDVAA